MKTTILGLMAALIFTACGVVQAQEVEQAKLGIDLDVTWVSKYIWRGYDLFDDHGAVQPSVNVDLFGTGFSVNAWGSIPLGTGSLQHGNGINEWQEYDYTVAYGCTFFENERYAVDFGVNYIYFDFPKQNRLADTQEIGVSLSMPNLIEVGTLAIVPGYYGGKLWPSASNNGPAGGYHSFSLSCDVPVQCPSNPEHEQVFSFMTDINYNDGLYGSEHVWSHATLGVSTSVQAGPFSITPALYYQISMGDADDSVNDEDELWGGLSVSYSF